MAMALGLKLYDLSLIKKSKSDKKAGGDSLYSQKAWDTSTGDFTMFAVARYAGDQTDESYKNNFVISDRSAKSNWLFGFGYNILGYTLLGWEGWEYVSRVTRRCMIFSFLVLSLWMMFFELQFQALIVTLLQFLMLKPISSLGLVLLSRVSSQEFLISSSGQTESV